MTPLEDSSSNFVVRLASSINDDTGTTSVVELDKDNHATASSSFSFSSPSHAIELIETISTTAGTTTTAANDDAALRVQYILVSVGIFGMLANATMLSGKWVY